MPTKTKSIKDLLTKGLLSKSEKQALDALLTHLESSWPGIKVMVFGSKVTGTADDESDLDVLILLPVEISEDVRRHIVHKVFDINLEWETSISPLIMSAAEWDRGPVSVLPIHFYIEREGVTL